MEPVQDAARLVAQLLPRQACCWAEQLSPEQDEQLSPEQDCCLEEEEEDVGMPCAQKASSGTWEADPHSFRAVTRRGTLSSLEAAESPQLTATPPPSSRATVVCCRTGKVLGAITASGAQKATRATDGSRKMSKEDLSM